MSNFKLVKSSNAQGAIGAYLIVKFGTLDGSSLQAAASTDTMYGVSTDIGADEGERCDVIKLGDAEVQYGGTVTRGDPLTSDANGCAITATRHTHAENAGATYVQNATTGTAALQRIVGYANVSGVAGDIGSVAVAPGYL